MIPQRPSTARAHTTSGDTSSVWLSTAGSFHGKSVSQSASRSAILLGRPHDEHPKPVGGNNSLPGKLYRLNTTNSLWLCSTFKSLTRRTSGPRAPQAACRHTERESRTRVPRPEPPSTRDTSCCTSAPLAERQISKSRNCAQHSSRSCPRRRTFIPTSSTVTSKQPRPPAPSPSKRNRLSNAGVRRNEALSRTRRTDDADLKARAVAQQARLAQAMHTNGRTPREQRGAPLGPGRLAVPSPPRRVRWLATALV